MTKRPIRSASNYSVYKIFIKVNLIDFNVDFYTVQKPYDQSLHFCQYFGAKKLHSQIVTTEKLLNLPSYKKCVSKMLMKLTPGVNFTNIL